METTDATPTVPLLSEYNFQPESMEYARTIMDEYCVQMNMKNMIERLTKK